MKNLFKKLKKLLKQKKGFTLIELLVVIGILGILAAALVATIDPFEQLNKAQDANIKNVMVEYLDANIRYYATHNDYPWGAGVAACTPEVVNNGMTDTGGTGQEASSPYKMPLCSGGTPSTGVGCTVTSCIPPLISDRELEASFVTAVGSLSKIYVSYYGSNGGNAGTSNANTLVACFLPVSQSGLKDVNTRYNIDGSNGTNCPSFPSGTGNHTGVCYWCTR